MHPRFVSGKAIWSIVIGDDHGPDWAPHNQGMAEPRPIQYRRLGDSTTLLEKAIRRATHVAPRSQVIVTLRSDHRAHWEPLLPFVDSQCRIVGFERCSSWLTTATAILTVLMRSPSAIVAVIPARSYVTHDEPLIEAIDRAVSLVPLVPEGVVTLGMIDISDGLDEDYLVLASDSSGPGLALRGVAKQPASWIAQHLRRQGALIASEILIGYVGAIAAHVTRIWPGLCSRLYKVHMDAAATRGETLIPESVQKGLSDAMLRSFRWYPPSLPQRATVVRHCGWSSLRSARAIGKIGAVVDSSNHVDQTAPICEIVAGQSREFSSATSPSRRSQHDF